MDDPYARQVAPDCVVPKHEVRRSVYLSRVAGAAVCLTTNGLQQSVGWRMAEFMALGRAVVSESSLVIHPGGFRAGEHHIVFGDVSDCLAAVDSLLLDSRRRQDLQGAALQYFEQYVRADMLVLNALRAAGCV